MRKSRDGEETFSSDPVTVAVAPSVLGVTVEATASEYCESHLTPDTRLLLSGFERWCEVEGHLGKRTTEEWDKLFSAFKSRKV